ncbi:hypothetical protein AB1Y20_012849 [Prymnesium parvum]|uniref:Mitochondrial import inner membrane translocase subunit TIM50 n=1 Tax=Prymnesium parvum TaxID=97485 RepID=A0AB34ILT3_PRYPA
MLPLFSRARALLGVRAASSLAASSLAASSLAASSLAAAAGLASAASCAAAPPPPPPPPASPAAAEEASAGGKLQQWKDSIYDYVIKPYAEPSRERLLPDVPPQIKGKEKPTLVVSLDGTLIESTWSRQYGWRYVKRPGVDVFLASLAPHYELVLWTESMNTADPVVERLDPRRFIRHRLYRDTTTYTGGKHIKDLGALNRSMSKVLIIDCEAACFSLHPRHGIAVPKYDSEADPNKEDRALTRLIPLLQERYLALTHAASKGTTSLVDELDKFPPPLRAARESLSFSRPQGEDVAAAFEQRLAELKKTGVRQNPTIWGRLRGARDGM